MAYIFMFLLPKGNIIVTAINIIVLVLVARSAYVWLDKKRNAVVEIQAGHSIKVGGYTLKREDLKSTRVERGRVIIMTGGHELTVAGPVKSKALAEALSDEIFKALQLEVVR